MTWLFLTLPTLLLQVVVVDIRSRLPQEQSTISLSGATTDGTTDPVSPGICSVTVSVTSFDVGNHTNIILTTDGSYTINGIPNNNFENDANITLLVLPMISPGITKSFKSPINVGEISQMEINIKNNDPNVALTQVELQDTFPAGMVLSDPLTTSLSNCGSGTLDPVAAGDLGIKFKWRNDHGRQYLSHSCQC